jgi:hypothetical protein
MMSQGAPVLYYDLILLLAGLRYTQTPQKVLLYFPKYNYM